MSKYMSYIVNKANITLQRPAIPSAALQDITGTWDPDNNTSVYPINMSASIVIQHKLNNLKHHHMYLVSCDTEPVMLTLYDNTAFINKLHAILPTSQPCITAIACYYGDFTYTHGTKKWKAVLQEPPYGSLVDIIDMVLTPPKNETKYLLRALYLCCDVLAQITRCLIVLTNMNLYPNNINSSSFMAYLTSNDNAHYIIKYAAFNNLTDNNANAPNVLLHTKHLINTILDNYKSITVFYGIESADDKNIKVVYKHYRELLSLINYNNSCSSLETIYIALVFTASALSTTIKWRH